MNVGAQDASRRRTMFSRTPAATAVTASAREGEEEEGTGRAPRASPVTSPPDGEGTGAFRAAAAAAETREVKASLRAAKSVSELI